MNISLSLTVCVYMCLCVHACMCACVQMCALVCVYVCMHVRIRMYVFVFLKISSSRNFYPWIKAELDIGKGKVSKWHTLCQKLICFKLSGCHSERWRWGFPVGHLSSCSQGLWDSTRSASTELFLMCFPALTFLSSGFNQTTMPKPKQDKQNKTP